MPKFPRISISLHMVHIAWRYTGSRARTFGRFHEVYQRTLESSEYGALTTGTPRRPIGT